jgi:ankyrin repeat protein
MNDEALSMLFKAAEQGNNRRVVLALERRGADVNATLQGTSKKALTAACIDGHAATVRLLLQRGANVEAVDSINRTALHYASIHGATDAAKELLDVGANVDCRDRDSLTPLMHACKSGHSAIVRLLVERGSNVETVDGPNRTALHFASLRGTPDAAKELLAAGANVNCRDVHRMTPLMIAVLNARSSGSSSIVNILVEAGADVKLRGYDGTALDIVVAQRGIAPERRDSAKLIPLLTKAARRQEASILLNWMLAMAPLELPICEGCNAHSVSITSFCTDICLNLANISFDDVHHIECEFAFVVCLNC